MKASSIHCPIDTVVGLIDPMAVCFIIFENLNTFCDNGPSNLESHQYWGFSEFLSSHVNFCVVNNY